MGPSLCYVTDRKSLGRNESAGELLKQIEIVVAAGVDWVQVREKDMPARELLALVHGALTAAQSAVSVHEAEGKTNDARAKVLVNDRLDVALSAGADGVHLGGESLPVRDVVRWRRNGNAPADFLIGLSCHRAPEAQEAERAGANYIFFGPVYDTPSKRRYGPPQGVARLAEICHRVRIPVIAIGGIHEGNAADCVGAGATGIAAIRMFQQPRSSREMRELLTRLRRMSQHGAAGRQASGRRGATPRYGRK